MLTNDKTNPQEHLDHQFMRQALIPEVNEYLPPCLI